MKPTVYVETSVLGYLTSWPSGHLIVAARQKTTRDWWRDAPAKYELVVSEAVVREASAGDAQAIQDRLAAIQGLPILPPSQEAQDLVDALLAQAAVPTTEPEDAAHIALAAVNGIEYLVTWNFKHIANASVRKQINSVCAGAG
jgi:predicted nucleic acid-binding protein